MQFIIWQWRTREYPYPCYCLFLCRGIQPEHVTFCFVSSSMFTFIAVCDSHTWIHVVGISLWACQTSAKEVQHIFIVASFFRNDTRILRTLRPVEQIHVCASQLKDLQQQRSTVDEWMDKREDPDQGSFSTASLAQSMRAVLIKYQLSISINFCRCFLRFTRVDLGSRVYEICIKDRSAFVNVLVISEIRDVRVNKISLKCLPQTKFLLRKIRVFSFILLHWLLFLRAHFQKAYIGTKKDNRVSYLVLCVLCLTIAREQASVSVQKSYRVTNCRMCSYSPETLALVLSMQIILWLTHALALRLRPVRIFSVSGANDSNKNAFASAVIQHNS